MVVSNLFFLEEGDALHRWAGYVAGVAITARIVWGMSVSGYVRIDAFFPTLQRIRRYLDCYAKHGRCATIGLNPLGAIMAIAMVMLVLFLVFTGWLMGTDAYWGEEWLESLHGVLSYALMAFIGVHIVMVFTISYRTKINLPKAMVTGSKERTANSASFRR